MHLHDYEFSLIVQFALIGEKLEPATVNEAEWYVQGINGQTKEDC